MQIIPATLAISLLISPCTTISYCRTSDTEIVWQIPDIDWEKWAENTPEITLPETPEQETPEEETPEEETPEEETPIQDDDIEVVESDFVQRVVQLVNEERVNNGLAPLEASAAVQSAAQVRAEEQAQLFSHTRPNGNSCFTALDEAGVTYRSAGENIAYGQTTPEQVMNGWMNSSGHRANILSEKYTTIGVGYAVINGTPYWAQLFIG